MWRKFKLSLSARCIVFVVVCSLRSDTATFSNVEEENLDLIVLTKHGLVQGSTIGETPYFKFHIPFAEPPVGNLRFEPPLQKRFWLGILNASKEVPACIQGSLTTTGSEDCLYLKVHTPKLPSFNFKERLPVMVWIHGGGFFMGSANFSETDPKFFLEQDIVVVGIQYRLGVFGFLSTGDLVAPGNNGLKDQVLALEWVKENIEAFGGDPKNVTIMGQSAGAVSVAYLLQTEKAEGLFHKAIMQSGVSLCIWSLSRDTHNMTRAVASAMNVNISTSLQLLQGLKSVDAYALHKHCFNLGLLVYAFNPFQAFAFTPVLEPEHSGAVITQRSYDILKSGRFHRVPLLVGHNSLELSFNIPDLLRIYLLKFDLLPDKLVPVDMNISDLKKKLDVANKVKLKYFGLIPVVFSNTTLSNYISDDQFVRPVQEYVQLTSRHSQVYYYKFSYEGRLGGVIDRITPGVSHTEELGYLFETNRSGFIIDYLVRDRMVKLWTNFIKTGNPTPEEDAVLENKIWPLANSLGENVTCMNIGLALFVEVDPDRTVVEFWRSLYDSYGNPPYDTY